jgi:PAS domain S-box-containing protein
MSWDQRGGIIYGVGVVLVAVLLSATGIHQIGEWREIEAHRLQRTAAIADLLADEVARSLEPADVVLDVLATELRYRAWHDWTETEGVAALAEFRARRHLPQLRDIIIFDRGANQRFLTRITPVPRLNVRDQPYFLAHESGVQAFVYGPYSSRNTGLATFAISRRIEDGMRHFDGVAMAVFEPSYFQKICSSPHLDVQVESALVNAEGAVIATCPATAGATAATGRPADQILAGGRLAGMLPLPGTGARKVGNQMVAASTVGDYALEIIVTVPLDGADAAWRVNTALHWLIGALALATIGLGSAIIRRQVSRLRALSAGLEEKVEERTAALGDSQKRFQTLTEATSEAIIIHADDWIEDCNPQMGLMFGSHTAPTDNGCGCPQVSALFAEESRQLARDAFAVADGQPMELRCQRRDGSQFPAEFRTKAASQNGRRVLVSAIRDLSSHKAMEENLVRLAEEANTANRAKSEFLAAMSHEIRTPMNGILGMAQALRDGSLVGAQAEYVDNLFTSGQALQSLLNDILDLSKLETGRLELIPQTVPVHPLVAQLCTVFRPRAEAKGIALLCTIADSVPDAVIADPLRLRQVLGNLVDNAIKFTAQGVVRLRVDVAENGQGQALTFEIEDTGIGMTADTLSSWATPFRQADADADPGGLGLAVSKRLVDLMGGRMTATSRPGNGTIFRCEIPAEAASLPESAPDDGPPQEGAPKDGTPKDESTSPLRPLSVLVVEDNLVNRKVVQAYLAHRGHRVTLAVNGVEAVQKATDQDFDVVLMDIRMPEMDGLEATRRIRTLPSPRGQVPIIALTANAYRTDSDACFAAGMNAFLAKPVDFAKLTETLWRHCGGK